MMSLAGRRIVVTRAGLSAETLIHRLEVLGASVVHCPAITFAPPHDPMPLHEAMGRLATYHWVLFTSARAAEAFATALDEHRRTHRVDTHASMPLVAVVGASTAEVAESYGWTVAFMPARSSGADLAAELPTTPGMRVLLPRADIASPGVPDQLRDRGCVVDDIVAYRTIANSVLASMVRDGAMHAVDALTFTSPSTVHAFVEAAEHEGWRMHEAQRVGRFVIVCIGATTEAALHDHHLRADAVALTPSNDGLVHALQTALQHRPHPTPDAHHHSGTS